MYSSTTYNHGLGYSRTYANVAAPVTTTTQVGAFGDAVTTTSHGGPWGGSTVTRTFSPGRSYLHGGLYGSTIVGAPLLGASVVHDPIYGGAYGAYAGSFAHTGAYGHTILSPGRTTTSYGPFGATTRTVNYF